MKAALYDQIHWVPVARKAPRQASAIGKRAQIADLEFSELYRSLRFQPGWFILPSLTMALAGMVIAVLLAR